MKTEPVLVVDVLGMPVYKGDSILFWEKTFMHEGWLLDVKGSGTPVAIVRRKSNGKRLLLKLEKKNPHSNTITSAKIVKTYKGRIEVEDEDS